MGKNDKTFLITLTLGILTAIGSISIDMYLPAFPVMAAYFNVPMVRIETTVTLFLFGMSFGQLFIGPLSDVWGRKVPLRIGMIIYVVCSICCMLTHSFTLFLALRFIQGLAGSACQVISRALVSDLYAGKNAAHIFTVLQILMGISPIIAPMIGGLLAEASTWKLLFLIMAIISGAGLAGCLTILPDGKIPAENRQINIREIRAAYLHCIKSPAFINYAVLRAISNSAAFSFVTASPFVFTQIYLLNRKQFGFLFSAIAVVIIIMGIINTRLLHHFRVKTIIHFAIAIQLVSGLGAIVTLYFDGPFYLLLGFMIAFLSMLGFVLPNATALFLSAVSSFSGAASALIGSMSYLCAFLITSLLSFLHNNTPYPMIATMFFCSLLAFLCLRYRNSGPNSLED